MTPDRCDGILLAAGAGTRYGMPKVLAEGGAWLRTAVAALRDGGCARIFVVLGATGPAYRAADGSWLVSRTSGIVLPEGVLPVWASDWEVGLSTSTRAGLAAAAAPTVSAVRPAVSSPVAAERVSAEHFIAARMEPSGNIAARNSGARNGAVRSFENPPEFVAIMPVDTPDVGGAVVSRVIAAARVSESRLARAVFGETPGHPVVLGREHWAGVSASARGNSGAGTYLRRRTDMVCVTCDDLATGLDRDYPADNAR